MIQEIDLGTAPDGQDGDNNRTANTKVNVLLAPMVAATGSLQLSEGNAVVSTSNTVYASTTCALDSSLLVGGGTDDTVNLQAAITAAAGGEFIQDGVSLVSDALVNGTNHTAALMVPPNTKITFLPGCGWFLKASSNCIVLSNTGLTGVIGGPPDKSITIKGYLSIAINCNSANQSKYERGISTNSWNYATWFGNVQDLVLDGLWIQDSVAFCFTISNGSTFRIKNCRNYQSTQISGSNTDTLHMFGPLDDIVTDNLWGNGTDDTLALNTNEGVANYLDSLSASPPVFGLFRFPQSGNGSITNATFRRTFFDGAWSGFRIYGIAGVSGSNPSVDNIRVLESRGSIGNIAWSESMSRIGQVAQIGLLQISDWKVGEVNTATGLNVCGTVEGSHALQCQLLRLENIDPSTTVNVQPLSGTQGVVAVDGDYFAPAGRSYLIPYVEVYYGFEVLLRDSTANGFSLTNNNAVTQTSGINGQAANFVAASSQSLSNAIGLLGGTTGTIAAWAKFGSLGANGAIYDNRNTGHGVVLSVDHTTGKLLFFCESTGNPSGQTVTGTSTNLNSGGWHHVAATFTASSVTLYVDGVAEAAPTTISPAYTAVATTNTYIGAGYDGANFANGAIDELVIFDIPLSAAVIKQLATPLLWPFVGSNG